MFMIVQVKTGHEQLVYIGNVTRIMPALRNNRDGYTMRIKFVDGDMLDVISPTFDEARQEFAFRHQPITY